MQLIERHIQQIRKDVDEAWNARTGEPDEKQSRTAQELVILSLGLWQSAREAVAEDRPRDRQAEREVAALLRDAEQALSAVLEFAGASSRAGLEIKRTAALATALREVRGMILTPTARQMAERDPQGRSAPVLRDLLLDRVTFSSGRPVFTAEVAKEFPYPLAPEPVG
jgi:hypothetical protein